jgi:hypothetical protein
MCKNGSGIGYSYKAIVASIVWVTGYSPHVTWIIREEYEFRALNGEYETGWECFSRFYARGQDFER